MLSSKLLAWSSWPTIQIIWPTVRLQQCNNHHFKALQSRQFIKKFDHALFGGSWVFQLICKAAAATTTGCICVFVYLYLVHLYFFIYICVVFVLMYFFAYSCICICAVGIPVMQSSCGYDYYGLARWQQDTLQGEQKNLKAFIFCFTIDKIGQTVLSKLSLLATKFIFLIW